MGLTLSCFGLPSSSSRSPKARYSDEKECNGSLADSVIKFVKQKCILTRTSNRSFHPHKKQNKQAITEDQGERCNKTLEDWLLSSPVQDKYTLNGGNYVSNKHFSNRIHPSLLDNLEVRSDLRRNVSEDKLLKELNGEDGNCSVAISRPSLSRSQSQKTKKRVSFRLPEKDEIIIYASPE